MNSGLLLMGVLAAATLAGCSASAESEGTLAPITPLTTTTEAAATTTQPPDTTLVPAAAAAPLAPAAAPSKPGATRGVLPCTAADLTATADPNVDAGVGLTRLVVHVTNTGTTDCRLPTTPPTLAGMTPDGTIVPLPAPPGQVYADAPVPLVRPLAVGATADVWIFAPRASTCSQSATPQTWQALLLGLPGDITLQFTSALDTKCGISGITALGAT